MFNEAKPEHALLYTQKSKNAICINKVKINVK